MEGDFNNHNGFFIINLLRIRAFRLVNIGCLWERLPGRDSFLIYTGDLIVSKTNGGKCISRVIWCTN